MKYDLNPARKITLEEAIRDVEKQKHILAVLEPIDGPYDKDLEKFQGKVPDQFIAEEENDG